MPVRFRPRGSPRFYEAQRLAKENLRRCTGCQAILSIEEFWKSDPGKRTTKCRTCLSTRQKAIRKKDTNTGKKRERSRRWRLAHPELYKARIAACTKANPAPKTEARRKRRVLQSKNGVYRVSQNDLRRLLVHQQGRCYLCDFPIIDKELDHIIPISKGGHHSIGNLGWTCHKCNRSKSNKLLSQFRFGGKKRIHETNPELRRRESNDHVGTQCTTSNESCGTLTA